jgi:hypothetical protein
VSIHNNVYPFFLIFFYCAGTSSIHTTFPSIPPFPPHTKDFAPFSDRVRPSRVERSRLFCGQCEARFPKNYNDRRSEIGYLDDHEITPAKTGKCRQAPQFPPRTPATTPQFPRERCSHLARKLRGDIPARSISDALRVPRTVLEVLLVHVQRHSPRRQPQAAGRDTEPLQALIRSSNHSPAP